MEIKVLKNKGDCGHSSEIRKMMLGNNFFGDERPVLLRNDCEVVGSNSVGRDFFSSAKSCNNKLPLLSPLGGYHET